MYDDRQGVHRVREVEIVSSDGVWLQSVHKCFWMVITPTLSQYVHTEVDDQESKVFGAWWSSMAVVRQRWEPAIKIIIVM